MNESMNASMKYKLEYLQKIEKALKGIGPFLSLEELDEIAIVLDSALKKIYIEAKKTEQN